MNKETLFKEICESLVEMEEEKVVELCAKTLEINIPAYETITEGLIPGMDEAASNTAHLIDKNVKKFQLDGKIVVGSYMAAMEPMKKPVVWNVDLK